MPSRSTWHKLRH